MKRIATLAMVCAFVLGSVCTAHAIDVQVKGQWEFTFGWADNVTGYGAAPGSQGFRDKGKGNNRDTFHARHRARTQIDFIASEQLSAQILLEIGDINWGRDNGKTGPSSGGGLNADGANVETKRAYLDWMIPQTDVTVRMGIQGIYLPSATGFYTPVYGTDATGITISSPITDWLGVTAFWVRAFDRYDTDPNESNSLDEMDIFGLVLPITLDGMKITPWALYSNIGGESGWWSYHNKYTAAKGYPDGFSDDAYAWHGGIAYELDMFDPLTFGVDVMYGYLEGDGSKYQNGSSNPGSRGWFVDAALRYKLDWATAGLFGWWSSGDDEDSLKDGKFGRIPVLADDQGFMATSFGFDASPALIGSDRAVSNTAVGTWGVGIELKDISFIEDLSHLIRVAYYMGTNDNEIIKNNGKRHTDNIINFGEFQYMTDKDYAIEVNFDHKYQIYENLAAFLELGYIHLELDDATWANSKTDEAWKAQVHFQFKF